MKLTVFVFRPTIDDDGESFFYDAVTDEYVPAKQELNLAYWNQSTVGGMQWIETFCFSEGHNETVEHYMDDVEPADLTDPEVIAFVAKVQAYYDSLPCEKLELVPVASWEDIELPNGCE